MNCGLTRYIRSFISRSLFNICLILSSTYDVEESGEESSDNTGGDVNAGDGSDDSTDDGGGGHFSE
jgi:hypothetical protein